MSKLVKALFKIVADDKPLGQNFLKSGNLTTKLKEIGVDAAINISDAHYDKNSAKEKEVSEKGYLLGRLNKTRKTVFRIEIPPYVLFYIGTEADVSRKIEESTKPKEDEKKV